VVNSKYKLKNNEGATDTGDIKNTCYSQNVSGASQLLVNRPR